MEDLLVLAKLRLEEMLTYFGANANVKAEIDGSTLELSVASDDTGRLIGRHGETLAALQQLINAIVRAQTTEHVYVSVDIADYKKGRAEQLGEQALADAKQVAETGQTKHLRPMNAAERRVIHMALAEDPAVETDSEGDGRDRHVVIRPKA